MKKLLALLFLLPCLLNAQGTKSLATGTGNQILVGRGTNGADFWNANAAYIYLAMSSTLTANFQPKTATLTQISSGTYVTSEALVRTSGTTFGSVAVGTISGTNAWLGPNSFNQNAEFGGLLTSPASSNYLDLSGSAIIFLNDMTFSGDGLYGWDGYSISGVGALNISPNGDLNLSPGGNFNLNTASASFNGNNLVFSVGGYINDQSGEVYAAHSDNATNATSATNAGFGSQSGNVLVTVDNIGFAQGDNGDFLTVNAAYEIIDGDSPNISALSYTASTGWIGQTRTSDDAFPTEKLATDGYVDQVVGGKQASIDLSIVTLVGGTASIVWVGGDVNRAWVQGHNGTVTNVGTLSTTYSGSTLFIKSTNPLDVSPVTVFKLP